MRVAPVGMAAALLLAGCGQKGPLYLPDRTGTVVTPAPAGAAPGAPAASPTAGAAPKKNDKGEGTPPPQ